MTLHNCLCANNKSGLCYGQASSAWHRQISEARADDGAADAPTYTDCPGYIAPGGAMYEGDPQIFAPVDPFLNE